MIKLGERHTDIKECIRFYNEQIASLPIFDELGIPDNVVIWYSIFIYKQVHMLQSMRMLSTIKIPLENYLRIFENIVNYATGMLTSSEMDRIKKNSTFKKICWYPLVRKKKIQQVVKWKIMSFIVT